jgi:copper(I)-binding protein
MRQKFAILVATTIALISACAPATQFEDHTGHITVENQVVNVSSGIITMSVRNHHDESVTLIRATTKVADKVVLMPKSSGLEIPGNSALLLVLKTHYLLLKGIHSPLIAGSEIKVTLEFSDGHLVNVLVPVKLLLH